MTALRRPDVDTTTAGPRLTPPPVVIPTIGPIDASVDVVVDMALPVFNEAHVLAASVDRLTRYLDDAFSFPWRITIVDNASTDDTLAVAHRIAERRGDVHVLHLEAKGRGRALKAAWSASTSPVVAYMDIDLSTRLDALLPLVAPIVSGHRDVVVGSRRVAGARVRRSFKRELISRSYNLLLALTLHPGVHDAQCGFKAISRAAAADLLGDIEDDGWFFDTELLALADERGFRILEIPVDWVEDPDSRVDLWHTAATDLAGVARLLGARWRNRAPEPLPPADPTIRARRAPTTTESNR